MSSNSEGWKFSTVSPSKFEKKRKKTLPLADCCTAALQWWLFTMVIHLPPNPWTINNWLHHRYKVIKEGPRHYKIYLLRTHPGCNSFEAEFIVLDVTPCQILSMRLTHRRMLKCFFQNSFKKNSVSDATSKHFWNTIYV